MGPSKRTTEIPDERFRPAGVGGVGGGVESQTQESQAVAKRIVEYELNQERLRTEENYGRIQEQLDAGQITEVEARKLVARAKMHESAANDVEDKSKFRGSAMAGADYSSANMMLETILDQEVEDKVSFLYGCFLKTFCLKSLHERAVREKRRRADRKFRHPVPLLKAFVYSPYFDFIVGSVMLANGVLIGVQVSGSGTGEQYDVYEHAFTAFFVFEITLRFIVDGWTWIWDTGNLGDFMLIMLTGVIPMWVLKPLKFNANALVRTFAVLRILRLVRLVRMVRFVPAFRIFWSLIQGIIDSGRTLMYTYFIITMVLYIFAIFAVYLIAKADAFEGDGLAIRYFGDVPRAMFTLFQVITLDSWTEVARPLMKKSSFVAPFFLVVITVVTLALLNLIVAVIVNNAFDRAKQDESLLVMQKREEMEKEIQDLQTLFTEIDSDGSGMLSKDEYDDAVNNHQEVITKFELLEISPNEYNDVWNLLDDGSGEVSVGQFSDLLRALKGDAKAKDTFSILRRVHQANIKMSRLSQRLTQHRQMASELRGEATQVRQALGALQHDMCEFLGFMGECIPSRPAETKSFDIEKFHNSLHDEASDMY